MPGFSFIKILIWIATMVLLLVPALEKSAYMFSESRDWIALALILAVIGLSFMYYREAIKEE